MIWSPPHRASPRRFGRFGRRALAGAVVLVAGLLGLASAAEARPEYCIHNRTDMALHVNFKLYKKQPVPRLMVEWLDQRRPLAPGATFCCPGRCSAKIRVGIDRRHRPSESEKRTIFVLEKVLGKLAKGAPTRPYIPQDEFSTFCAAEMSLHDRLEVFGGRDWVRCDQVARSNWTRASYGPKGRVETPTVGFRFCNQSRTKTAYAAVAVAAGRNGWRSLGWYGVKPGACRRIALGRGYRGKAYYRATRAGSVWSGKHQLCGHPSKPFEVDHAEKGCRSGLQKLGFREKVLRWGKDLKLTLTER